MAEDSSEITREAAESVAFVNSKSLGDGPAFFHNLAMSNAVAQQQSMFAISNAITAKVAELLVTTSPGEGGADVAALQQLLKGAQTTPPVTGG
jgi:hypothetical protein